MLPRKWKYITIFIIIFFCLFTFTAKAEDEEEGKDNDGDDGGGDDGADGDDDKEEGEEKSEKEDEEEEGDGEDEEEKNGDKENEKEEDEDKEGNDDEEDDKESEDEKSEVLQDEKEGEEGDEEDEEDDEAQSKSSKSKKVKKRKRGDDDDEEEESKNDEAESEVDNGSDEEGSREHKKAKNRRYICQDKDGNFVPLAYVCADVYHKKTCRALFPHDPDDPHGRPPNCDLDEIKDVVYKCAHHCKVCCMLSAYGCGDDPTYDFDCESRKHLCEKLPKLMNIACPSSCGTCHIGPCKDTVDGCISMRSTMCKHHKEFNKDLHECARSCKLCTPRCVDLSDKCAEADQSACLRPPDDKPEENVYYKAMSRVCRKSCNLCDEPFDDLEESKLIETKLNNKRTREEDDDIISEVINSNDDGDEVVSKRRRINSNNDESEMEGDNDSDDSKSEVEDK